MGLRVTFVSGPRRCGKSTVVQAMVERLWKNKPHYLRLTNSKSDKLPPKTSCAPAELAVASARWLHYDPHRIFEILPEALAEIHKRDRYGCVVIEADADPNLRCAYPYDHRVFVMPLPIAIREVFRDPRRAAEELHRVLDDTAAFASEIFGLFEARDDNEPREPRPELSATQMRGFLYSPLGDELATRIQLQQEYHGLVESDVIVVNSCCREATGETDECIRRVGQLLARVRGEKGRARELFVCDLTDAGSEKTRLLFQALRPMCQQGT